MIFAIGYDDCTTCKGTGIVFDEHDIPLSCPECSQRDNELEKAING